MEGIDNPAVAAELLPRVGSSTSIRLARHLRSVTSLRRTSSLSALPSIAHNGRPMAPLSTPLISALFADDGHTASFSSNVHAPPPSNLENLSQSLLAKTQVRQSPSEKSGEIVTDLSLHSAALLGLADITRTLVANGARIDERDATGATPLSVASQNGHFEVVKVLLEQGANMDVVDLEGDCPLGLAAQHGHVTVVEILLHHGARIDFADADAATPLYLAAQNGHSRVVAVLLQRGAEPDYADRGGTTPLYAAACNGHADAVDHLLRSGAKGDFITETGVTPLYAAAFNGYTAVVQILLERGVDANFKTAVGVTPLYIAAQNGYTKVVAVLLKHGADVNLAAPSRATPLFIAAQNGHLRVVEILIQNGAFATSADVDGATPLYVASQNGHSDVVELLLRHGANVDGVEPDEGVTPLFIAAQNGHIGVVRLLLANSAHVNLPALDETTPLLVAAQHEYLAISTTLLAQRDEKGMTPLHLASQSGHVKVVKLLLKHGAKVNVTNNDGDTPLALAAQTGQVDVAIVLLNNTAGVSIQNFAGISPLHHAVWNSHQRMVELLLLYGADPNQPANNGRPPLFAAACSGDVEVVTTLLNSDAEIDLAVDVTPTAIYAAASHGHFSIVRTLIDHGADMKYVAPDGFTPLGIASHNGHYSVVELLLDRGVPVNDANKECRFDPLYAASMNGHSSVVQLLIRRHANVHASGSNGKTCLHIASEFGHVNVVRSLVDAGVQSDSRDAAGDTPLIAASRIGCIEIVHLLLNVPRSSDVNDTNRAGESALLAAARMGNFDVVKKLVNVGATTEIRAEDGETLLISAARWCESEAITWLTHAAELVALFAATIRTLQDYGSEVHEFRQKWRGVIERMEDLLSYCERNRVVQSVWAPQLATMVFRLVRLYQLCKETNIFTRIAISANVATRIRDFHKEIDFLYRRVSSESGDANDWVITATGGSLNELEVFSGEILPSEEELFSVLEDEASLIEAITLLRHEIDARSDKHSGDNLEMMKLCLDKLLSLSNLQASPAPSWFIPRHEVHFGVSNILWRGEARTLSAGKWMNSAVIIAQCSAERERFVSDTAVWFELSHPNVVKLFGASHVSRPQFAVFENVTSVHLREYLVRDEGASVWQKLLEVALGLKYLHERGITLGMLSCDHIWVGTDGVAKVWCFGQEFCSSRSVDGFEDVRWRAPEVVRGDTPSRASDVYSLGMCIIEAISGEAPWGSESCEQVRGLVRWGFWPPCPVSLSLDQWRLVQCMCVYNPSKRLKIVHVIEHLRYFATREEEQSRMDCDVSSGVVCNGFLRLGSSPEDFLARLRAKGMLCRRRRPSVLYIQARLADVHLRLKELHKLPTDASMSRFCEVLLAFDAFLRVAVTENSINQQIRSQKATLEAHVFHKQIDEILELLRLPGAADSIHDWVKQEELLSLHHKSSSTEQRGVKISDDGAAGAGKGVNLLCFESKQLNEKFNPSRFVMVDRRVRESAHPPWFIPMHELSFQSDGYISAGSFGAVYHGSWLGSPVVVKLMGYADEVNGLDLFRHELRVWFPLNHPHVVKLYGACNIGKRFFVCEYASKGTLRTFLNRLEDRFERLWQLLYEVALGLQYLHELNIIHNDLKCDNFLVSSDGRAKLTDFGLSSIPNSAEIRIDLKVQGAQHWKSPEVLQGKQATKASDIYSLGMCIIEAATDAAPWGSAVDAAVRFHVKHGRLPPHPSTVTDDQWDLIEMMCASDPLRRIKIQSVVERLEEQSSAKKSPMLMKPDALES